MTTSTHKYMSQEIGDAERMATFAVREDILETILGRLRADAGTGSFNSFHIVGPRGAGKTTLLHMVRQHVAADANLTKHYWPVILPEEQVAASSLRDFLAAILEQMKEDGSATAASWYDRCQAESDDEASAAIAEAGLTELARFADKILLIGVENFDRVLYQTLSTDQERAVLRRLMIDRPILCLLASSTRLLESADRYDDPLFGHFLPIELPVLDDKQAERLLQSYADYRRDKALKRRLRKSHSVVRSLNHLTGGNPRLLLMLYDVISLKKIDMAIDALRALVDEMTPLYNGLLDQLPTGPRKVLDAIMRAGGSAQPTNIAESLRGMKLAEVTSHLRRLKRDGYVSTHKGGKGRPAYYTASDRFFGTWYRLRYLRAGKRPIELFVEFLQAWYTAEERFAALRQQLKILDESDGSASTSRSSDYLFYSMSSTDKFPDALHAMIERADEHLSSGNAAAAITDYTLTIDLPDVPVGQRSRALGRRGVAHWQSGDIANAVADWSSIIDMPAAPAELRAGAFVARGIARGQSGDATAAIADYSCAIDIADTPIDARTWALNNRGRLHSRVGNAAAAIADFSDVIAITSASVEDHAEALINRGIARAKVGDTTAAIADYSRVIELPGALAYQRAGAFLNRGVLHGETGDAAAEIADYSQVVNIPDSLAEQRAKALINRGMAYGSAKDAAAAIEDYSRVIAMTDAPIAQSARALVNRGTALAETGDVAVAISDYSRVIDMPDAPAEQRARALVHRGFTHEDTGDTRTAVADFSRVIDMPDSPIEQRTRAFIGRGNANSDAGNVIAAIADYSVVIDMQDAPIEQRARALISRGMAYTDAGDATAAIADFSRVIDRNDVPATRHAWALVNRGIAHGEMGNIAAEVADYSRVIAMPEASVQARAMAFVMRGAVRGRTGDITAAMSDWEQFAATAEHRQLAVSATAFLQALARPALRGQWVKIFESVIRSLPKEVHEILLPLRLVANRLAGGADAEIDRQSPEIRDFALEVLAAFDAPAEQLSAQDTTAIPD